MQIGYPPKPSGRDAGRRHPRKRVKKLAAAKHTVLVQSGAGAGASIPDADFRAAGAAIAADAAEVYSPARDGLKCVPRRRRSSPCSGATSWWSAC